jgi:hypothetical protein
MQKQTKILFAVMFTLILALSITSAMSVKSVDANNFQPGSQQEITLKVKNTIGTDVEEVSLTLDLSNLPFSLSESEDNPDEISDDDTENFDFTLKASGSAKAGDYQIPYTLNYDGNQTKKGTFTLTIEAEPELVYSVSTDTPVVGSKAKMTLNLINKGLGDAKFVSITLIPDGYTLLSNENVYVGTIDSDDTQKENFEVIFTKPNPTLTAKIEYREFDNNLITKTITLPLTVYSQEQALKIGIIHPNNTGIYILLTAVGIIGWIIIRRIRKKKRLNKAQGR